MMLQPDLLANLYASTVDRSRLTLALDRVREITNASSATLHVFKRSATRLRHQWQHSCSVTPLSAYSLALLDDQNPRTLSFINPPSSTPCLLEDTDLPDAFHPQVRQWQEQLRKEGMGHFVAARVSLDQDREVGLALHAKVDGSLMAQGATNLMFELMPHVRETVMLATRVDANVERSKALAAAFDRIEPGLATVTTDGRILSITKSARRLLGLFDFAEFLPSSLQAHIAVSENRDFVCWQIASKHLHICIEPLDRSAGSADRTDRVGSIWLLAIRDVDEQDVIPSCDWAECYGLTKAELGILSCLVVGDDINQIAKGRVISIYTARTQLKSAMSKIGVKRQSQLMRLAWTSPTCWLSPQK